MKTLLAALAFAVPAFSNELGVGVAPASPQSIYNMTDPMEARQAKGEPSQVRVGLRLLPFVSAKTENLKGEIAEIVRPATEIKRTLRMRMNTTNHFIIDDYHIESVPMAYIKTTKQFELRLKFSKRLGRSGDVEEAIGHLDLKGILEGDKGLYVLKAASAKQFLDPMGRPSLKVVAGEGQAVVRSDSISKKDPSGAGNQLKESAKAPRARLPGSQTGF